MFTGSSSRSKNFHKYVEEKTRQNVTYQTYLKLKLFLRLKYLNIIDIDIAIDESSEPVTGNESDHS